MNRRLLRRWLVTAGAVWLIAGMTLALSHRHDHEHCAPTKPVETLAQGHSHPHKHGCGHSHKHNHVHSHEHSHPAPVPANSPLPCRDDDCSLCQFLCVPHAAPPSVTLVGEPICVAFAERTVGPQCELPPPILAAAPRAPPQNLEASC